MRYSQLLGKTKKEKPKDEVSVNAQLLIQAGFIHKEMAGVYTYLPLGLRVLNKINNVLREEMNNIGGQELFLTTLQEKDLWEKTGRWDDSVVDVWFKTQLKNGGQLGLALTHEEPLTNIVSKYVQSYKDLPMYLYQIQNKFRNEIRSKSGIMRGREFLMKDLYSFNASEEDLNEFYEKASEAYLKFFARVGLGDITFKTFASGGIFSKYSHEFQTLCENGEDIIYLHEEKRLAINQEVFTNEVLTDLEINREDLQERKSIEVGNIFKLGTRFSETLGLKYLDENGESKPVIMGSYGIGTGRTMGAVVETNFDEKGIIWPENIAPYKFHLVGLNLDDPQVKEKAESVYKMLLSDTEEVLFDDRAEVTAGQKFADADLIGCPYRLVVSAKAGDKVELKNRKSGQTELVSAESILKEGFATISDTGTGR